MPVRSIRTLVCCACFDLMMIGTALTQELRQSRFKADCPYELYGICDPFVPGIIANEEGKVGNTWPLGPAERAGICPGDQIIRVGDEPFSIRAAIGLDPSPVRLTVRRDGKQFERVVGRVRESELRSLSGIKQVETAEGIQTLPMYQTQELPLQLRNGTAGSSSRSWSLIPGKGHQDTGDHYYLGLRLLHVASRGEAIVENIDYPSPAYDAHLQLGDLVASINGVDPRSMSAEDLRRIFEPFQQTAVSLEIVRKEGNVKISITPTKYSHSLSRIGRKLTGCGPIPLHCTCSR